MPATVTVNFMTVVHKASNGMNTAFPDVCKTPAPPSPSPIPIPYPNIAMSSDAADTASTVKADGNPIMLQSSKYAMSSGDEAGSLFGMVSNKNKGTASPKMFSMDVKADGKNVFRQLDIMTQNGGSDPPNTPPFPTLQPPSMSMPPSADPKKWEIVETKWGATKCKCGDSVKIESKTKDYPANVQILHTLHRNGSRGIHTMLKGPVSGDKVDITWWAQHGPWKSDATKLKIKAHGGKSTKESGNELEIEIPQPFKESVSISNANNLVPGYKRQMVPVPVQQQVTVPVVSLFGMKFGKKTVTKTVMQQQEQIVPTGSNWAWEYGYDLELKDGKLELLCKIKLVPRDDDVNGEMISLTGASYTRAKARWKREIESTWTERWKVHRTGCKRGDRCSCPSGCCGFPIHVRVEFVDAGEHVTVNLWPKAPRPIKIDATGKRVANDGHAIAGGTWNPEWWDSGNWYELLCGREGNGPVVHAHEFGHNIGMADEYTYADGSFMLAAYSNTPDSLMNKGTGIQKQHWDTHPAQSAAGNAKPIFKRIQEGLKDNDYKLLPM